MLGLLAAQASAQIAVPELVELSGLATSRLRDDVLWAHNDGGSAPRLYAIRTDGESLGSIAVDGASAIDWEDIASFEFDGVPYLVIGDVGDNAAARPTVSLHFVREPVIPSGGFEEGVVVRPEWTMEFRYDDGPRDCEAIAVDVPGQRVLLMSKRKPPAVYAIPLRSPAVEAARVADRVRIPAFGEDDGRFLAAIGRFVAQPTAMDLTADGRLAVVQTYADAWLFRRKPGQSWREAFGGEPERVRVPRLGQAEAVTFDRSGEVVFVSGEGTPSPLVRTSLNRK